MENILGNKEGFCKNLTVCKMEAHRKEARRDFNRLGERIAHPKNFQRENEHRGQIGIHVFGDDFGPNGSKSSEKGRQKSK